MNTGTPLLPGPHKPSKVQAIAIMTLVNGILNVLWGLGVAGGLLWTVVCWPIGAYPIVLGVLEIVYASKLLSDNPGAIQPARYLAIMEICNVLLGLLRRPRGQGVLRRTRSPAPAHELNRDIPPTSDRSSLPVAFFVPRRSATESEMSRI